jgi:large subunit ribosomal protein L20
MTRVKRGIVAKKRRKKIINFTKGFTGSHSRLFRTANQQYMKAFKYSFCDRRKRKSNFKSLWINRINIILRRNNKSYKDITNLLTRKKIIFNKKILSKILILDNLIINKIITLEKYNHI